MMSKKKDARLAKCPVCHECFKHPSRLAYVEADQRKIEEEVSRRETLPASVPPQATSTGVPLQTRKELYVSRKYLDRFLDSPAYETLCRVDYHGVNNMHKLRKEISESYAIMETIQESCTELEIPSTLEDIFIIDMCSGKSLTSTICGALYPKAKLLSVDKLHARNVPHFAELNCNATYLSHDIMTLPFKTRLEEEIKHAVSLDRVVILVGMHLCGHLALRAIDLFHQLPLACGLILSPCCLPKRYGVPIMSTQHGGYSAEESVYEDWCNHLIQKIETNSSSYSTISGSLQGSFESTVKHRDNDMHSTKNCIIRTLRRPCQDE